MTDPQTRQFYQTHAAALAAEAEHLLSEPSPALQRAFPTPCKLLDVGCGSGAEVITLLQRGFDAFGTDASPELLQAAAHLARTRHTPADGRFLPAELPALAPFADAEFDALLCNAVLMHLPPESLFDAVYGLRRILKPGGRLLVSIPAERADVAPDTRRDPRGRLFTDLPPEKLILLLERIGFLLQWREDTPDRLHRPGIRWATLCFDLPADGAERPLHQVESILNRDKKDATYKLALFRALAELAQTQSGLAEFLPGGIVAIPTRDLALKWLYYYWPLIDSDTYIAQKNGERPACAKPTVVRSRLEPLVSAYAARGGLTAFHTDYTANRLSPPHQTLLKSILSDLQRTIWDMPARYAGGGEDFSVFQYDRQRKALLMQAALWRELCLTGSWIADATLLRWAELCAAFSRGRLRPSEVVDRLLIVPDTERRVADAREVFLHLPDRFCVWTGASLHSGFDVDHAIPFSLWRNNDLWNLFPASPRVNNQKRDSIPTWNHVQHQRDLIIQVWRNLYGQHPHRFEREAMTLLGRDTFDKSRWELLLFSRFAESMESTAIQRGSARWEPEGFRAARKPAPVRRTTSPTPYPKTAPDVHILTDRTVGAPADNSRTVGAPADNSRTVGAPADNSRTAGAPADNSRTAGAPAAVPQKIPLLRFEDIQPQAWKTALPLVGGLAAGYAFHGFDIENLATEAANCDWMDVPARLANPNRFVVQVRGDSMEPTLPEGSFAVFEYHRRPREAGTIVIANLNELGTQHGTEAIKRIHITPTHWEFRSDNPDYRPFKLPLEEHPYPILGVFVGRIDT